MRDIRSDLKERLATAEAKRAQFNASLKALDAEVDAIMRLLAIEEKRDSAQSAQPENAIPLAQFLLAAAEKKAMTKEDFRMTATAHGYQIDGRHIHAHVTNLVRSGELLKGPNETFRTIENSSNILGGAVANH